jgi:hypothetical protein
MEGVGKSPAPSSLFIIIATLTPLFIAESIAKTADINCP